MNKPQCSHVRALLVDYADQELSPGDSASVARHLADCPACRAELERMQASLALAQAVWAEATRGAPARTHVGSSRVRAAAIASCIVVAAAVALIVFPHVSFWWTHPSEVDTTVARPLQRPDGAPAPADDTSIAAMDIEAYIAREARSARLAAAASFLAEHEELDSYRKTAQQYLQNRYGLDSNKTTDSHNGPVTNEG